MNASAAIPDDNDRKLTGDLLDDPEENAGTPGSFGSEEWDPPIPLETRNTPDFPVAALPSPIREFAEAIAEATQTPPEMAATLSMAAVAACLQGRVAVQVAEGYVEPMSLYVAVVSEPGTRKTAVINAITEPIQEWERVEANRLAPRIERARTERAVKEKRKVRLEEEAARAKDQGDSAERSREAISLATELAAGSSALEYPRILADDVTPEQLARLMKEQGERIAIFSAEGGVFETMAGRYSQGVPNLDVYLKGHAGDWLRVDRRGGPPVIMDRPALTMGLAVQPDVLRTLVDKPGLRGRGLLGRYLYVLPPNLLGRRRVDASPIPSAVRSAYHKLIANLLRTEAPDGGRPRLLALTPAARDLWLGFSRRIEPRLGPGGDLAHITDWAGKAAGAAARIAGLFHAIRCAQSNGDIDGSVGADDMRSAIAMIETFFIPHAVTAFAQMGADPELDAAKAVLSWMRSRGIDDISVRDAHDSLRGQTWFRRVDAVEQAFELLERHLYVRRLPDPPRVGPGRPRGARYRVGPFGVQGP